MTSFKADKYEFILELNIGLIEDIKEQTGTSIDELIQTPEKMAEITFNNPRKLVEVLWVMCEEQCKSVPLTPKEFGRLFTRTVIDAACSAFMESVLLFYPRASVGNVLRENLPLAIEKMDKELVRQTRERMKTVLSNIVTDLPESSAG